MTTATTTTTPRSHHTPQEWAALQARLDAEKHAAPITPAEAIAEIRKRGGETEIVGKYGAETITCRAGVGRGMQLWGAEGWRSYGRRHPARHACLAYLVGRDDAGIWAVRVPGTTRSISEALEWMEPAEVATAREAGRRVLRQGDIYVVECGDGRDRMSEADLPASHGWRERTRYLVHVPADGRKHRPLKVSFPARVYRQRVYSMGRSGRRSWGD